MTQHEILESVGSILASLVFYWAGYHRGKRAGLLHGGKLALEAIAEWRRKYGYR